MRTVLMRLCSLPRVVSLMTGMMLILPPFAIQGAEPSPPAVPPLHEAAKASVAIPGAPQAAEQPNVLLVVTDDQGYWDTGWSGNEQIDTPAMDRLAEEGVAFARFYVAPVCAPTRAGLMTGRHYLRTGIYNTRFGGDTLGRDEITLAELLKQAGYRTGLFGKWHLGKYAGYRPHERGFDEFLGHYHGHVERYEYADQLVHNGRPVHTRGYVTDLFTDAAIEFVETSDGRPFFCYLAYNAPHSPFVLDTSHDHQPEGDALIDKYLQRGLPLREARIYGMVERIDRNLDRLLKRLAELNLAENTVVLFMSDNGGVSRGFKAGLRGFKAGVFEGGVRAPLFVRWPGRFPAGATIDAQTSHVDLLPTICDLSGVRLPRDRPIDGRSLLSLLKAGRGEPTQRYVYHTWDRFFPNPDERWAISDGRWKLLRQGGKLALFDLREDPGETRNAADRHPDRVRELRAEFVRWFEEVTDGQDYRPIRIPVGDPREPRVELQPSWATLEGETIEYVFRAYDWDTIEGWNRPDESATWQLNVQRAGRYEVAISYGRGGRKAGGLLCLSAERPGVDGDVTASLQFTPEHTPTADVFVTQTLGTFELRQGPTELKAKVLQSRGGELMRLNGIWLNRLED